MKTTKVSLVKAIREALVHHVPELAEALVKESPDLKPMVDNKAMIDDYLKQIAAELIKDPTRAGELLTTFQPAMDLDKHQQSMEGAGRIEAFLDKVEAGLQTHGVDRTTAIKFVDSFLKFR